jgi:hypothetical protein
VLLECAHGHKLKWEDMAKTDAQGHLELVLPYATAEPNGEIRAVDDYFVLVGGSAYSVRVNERQVLDGGYLDPSQVRPRQKN